MKIKILALIIFVAFAFIGFSFLGQVKTDQAHQVAVEKTEASIQEAVSGQDGDIQKTTVPKNDCEIALIDPRVSPEDKKKIREVAPDIITVSVPVRLDTVDEPLQLVMASNGSDISPVGTFRAFIGGNWVYAQFNEDGSAVVYLDYYGCGKYAGKYEGYLYHLKGEGTWSKEGQKILFDPRYTNGDVGHLTMEISNGKLLTEEGYVEPPSSPGGLATALSRMVEWARIK